MILISIIIIESSILIGIAITFRSTVHVAIIVLSSAISPVLVVAKQRDIVIIIAPVYSMIIVDVDLPIAVAKRDWRCLLLLLLLKLSGQCGCFEVLGIGEMMSVVKGYVADVDRHCTE